MSETNHSIPISDFLLREELQLARLPDPWRRGARALWVCPCCGRRSYYRRHVVQHLLNTHRKNPLLLCS